MEVRDYEQEAREQGWKPKEDFKGPDEKWTDAQTFVEKGDKIAGILKSRLDRQDQQIQKLLSDNKAFGEYQKNLLDKSKAESASRLTELEALRATAITDADGAEYTRVDREIQQVRNDMNAQPISQEKQMNGLSEAFLINNPWYGQNQKLHTYADGLADRIDYEGYTGAAFFTELTRRVKEAFPEEFENKRQSEATVEKGGDQVTKVSNSRTFDDLPADSKRACDNFIKGGFVKDRKDYLASYEWDE